MILVTGGTGLVGSHLLYKLVNGGHQVRAIYRTKEKLEKVKHIFSYHTKNQGLLFSNIEWILADITDTPSLEIAFKDITEVYHCAADLSFGPQNYEASKETNVIGTANIVNFCLSGEVEKLCYVSSIATLGEYQTNAITEETPWNPEKNKNNIYAITKYNAEMEVWRGVQEGLDVVIVKPGVIIGPGFWNSNTGDLFTKIANGFCYYTSGSVGIVDVNDVAEAMILLMNADVKNDSFIIVSENISYKTLITSISNCLNTKATPRAVQKWMLIIFFYFEKIKYFFMKGNPVLSIANIDSAFKNLNYSNAKIKKTIDFNFLPLSESIKQISECYLSDLK